MSLRATGLALAVLASLLTFAESAQARGFETEYLFHGQGTEPLGLTAYRGRLYGATAGGGGSHSGTLYSFDPSTGVVTRLYALGASGNDGIGPDSRLVAGGGKLWGLTRLGGGCQLGCATLFSYDLATGRETVAHVFSGGPAKQPEPVELLYNSGKIYGTTLKGGPCDCGTVFSFDPATKAFATIYEFPGASAGAYPGYLIALGGLLYGETSEGGLITKACRAGCGTVFSLDPASGAETVVHAFQGGPDGEAPGGLVNVGGELYGSTLNPNCQSNCGTVFSLDRASGVKTVLYSFTGGADGSYPAGDLVVLGPTLYGESGGGAHGQGAVFSIDLPSKTERVLHAFSGHHGDGAAPEGGPVAFQHRLVGVTLEGGHPTCGRNDCGTIFSFAPNS